MAHRNRWFTELKHGGSFHGELLVITRWYSNLLACDWHGFGIWWKYTRDLLAWSKNRWVWPGAKIDGPGADHIYHHRNLLFFSGLLLQKPSLFINQPMGIWDIYGSVFCYWHSHRCSCWIMLNPPRKEVFVWLIWLFPYVGYTCILEKAQINADLRDFCFLSVFSPHERNCTTLGIFALCAFWSQHFI